MKPIGLLMREHRLIERMIKLLDKELQTYKKSQKIDTDVIFSAIDFLKIYADRTHHGKEEDILFRELRKKDISNEHQKIMKKLIDDHRTSRKTVDILLDANMSYAQGNNDAIIDIQRCLEKLITLYPNHIKLEDTEFFFPVMEYFTQDEHNSMLTEFYDFDKQIIHEKYQKIVEKYEIK
jgi:hemerythrin-like domain-containing protein